MKKKRNVNFFVCRHKMQISEVVLGVLLCSLILVDIPIPRWILSFLGSMPGIVVLLGIVFYLFTQTPTLGVLSFIAAYVLVQRSGFLDSGFDRIRVKTMEMPSLPEVNIDGITFSATSQFAETLEESVIKSLVPLVRDTEAPFFSVAGSGGGVHDAAAV